MGLASFFCLVYSYTEECPLKIYIVMYVFIQVEFPTSCCSRLGPQLALLIGSNVFLWVVLNLFMVVL